VLHQAAHTVELDDPLGAGRKLRLHLCHLLLQGLLAGAQDDDLRLAAAAQDLWQRLQQHVHTLLLLQPACDIARDV
jgi:hypothetical protein